LAEALRTLSVQAAETQKDVAAISDVTGLIKQIAGQTNLLALNAAIEAARVGEQGRGFAVVAEEVRKLAQSTGESVKDISQKLQNIIGAVDAMVRDVARLEELAQNQAASTEEIHASMSEIAAGAEKVRKVANELV
jgi:methyl-accepting chemotaxis protein